MAARRLSRDSAGVTAPSSGRQGGQAERDSITKELTMQINVTGHHVDVTDSMREYVDNKFERLERHFDHVIDVHVILTVEKLRQKAESTIKVNGANIFADSTHEDMYAAIDLLVDKLDRQVIKHKEKMQDRRGAQRRDQ
jgi:putative sigma-54 modulation protein